jgi:hypothetical protein
MAEWICSQPAHPKTCPQCRSELPSLPNQLRAYSPGRQLEDDDFDAGSDGVGDSTNASDFFGDNESDYGIGDSTDGYF